MTLTVPSHLTVPFTITITANLTALISADKRSSLAP
jgi:hypothetical protein